MFDASCLSITLICFQGFNISIRGIKGWHTYTRCTCLFFINLNLNMIETRVFVCVHIFWFLIHEIDEYVRNLKNCFPKENLYTVMAKTEFNNANNEIGQISFHKLNETINSRMEYLCVCPRVYINTWTLNKKKKQALIFHRGIWLWIQTKLPQNVIFDRKV